MNNHDLIKELSSYRYTVNLFGYSNNLVKALELSVDAATYNENMYGAIKHLITQFTKHSDDWGGGYISDINDQTRIITVMLAERDRWNDYKYLMDWGASSDE